MLNESSTSNAIRRSTTDQTTSEVNIRSEPLPQSWWSQNDTGDEHALLKYHMTYTWSSMDEKIPAGHCPLPGG